MPKTLSQADKEKIRQARIQERADERQQEKEAVQEFYAARQTSTQNSPAQPLSAKEKRAQKKEQPGKWRENFTADAQASSSLAPVPEKELVEDEIEKLRQQLKMDFAAASSSRIVYNHSTHCEGLRPFIVKLSKLLPKDTTIIPGPLSTSSAHYTEFSFVFNKEKDNAYEFFARNGHTLQTVLISVNDPERFNAEYVIELVNKVLQNQSSLSKTDASSSSLLLDNPAQVNKATAELSASLWKTDAKKQTDYAQEQFQKSQQQQQLDERVRKLKSKINPGTTANALEEIAQRDLDIISGKKRGRNAMR